MRVIVCAVLLALGCGENEPASPAGARSEGELSIGVVSGEEGRPPCKLTFEGVEGTPDPEWPEPVGEWIAPEAYRVARTVVAAECALPLAVPVGRYRLTVSRGPEYEIAVRDVHVRADMPVRLEVELRRAVDATGLACADFHVHSAPSFDSDVPLDQRLLSAFTEGLDAIVPTDHDAMGEWDIPLGDLGLSDRLLVMPGDELTPDHWSAPSFFGHVGLYPAPAGLDPSLLVLPGQGIEELLGTARMIAPNALLQINHPRWNELNGHFLALGFEHVPEFDVVEVWNGHELDAREGGSTLDEVLHDWWALLSMGIHLVATGNSDTHRLDVTPVGYPRTCIQVPDDASPGTLAESLLEGLRSGAAFVTSGPFVELSVDGGRPGDLVRSSGIVRAEARVQAASWVDVERVTWVVSGEPWETQSLAAPMPVTVATDIPVDRDAWLIVMVEGDEPLGPATGRRNHPLRSLAFTNPVFIDADGDGLWSPPG